MSPLRTLFFSSLVALAAASLGAPGCSLRYDVDDLGGDLDGQAGAVADSGPSGGDGGAGPGGEDGGDTSDGGDDGGDTSDGGDNGGDGGDLPDAAPRPDARPGSPDAAPDCGGSGEICCDHEPACEDRFEECRNGTCQPCGGTLQSCCDPGRRCAGLLNCTAGLCVL